jgi:leucyl aminopeptidase (aminopeptidase T)
MYLSGCGFAVPGETSVSEYETLAKNVIRRTLHIQPKENVIVECWNHGLPIATEVVYQARAVGARPMLLFEDEDTYWRSVNTLPESKLGQVGSHEWKAMAEADGYVFIPGPADITKIREAGKKYSAATAYNDDWYKRAKRNRLRGARIGLGYVTEPRARAYGFDLNDWRTMMLEASSVDGRDIVRAGRKVTRLLSKKGRLEISHPNGTQFACDLVGRPAGIEDGIITKEDLDIGDNMANLPAGEAFVVADEKSGEGTIVFNRPIAWLGRWIRDVRIAFDGGRLTKFSASENEEFIRTDWDEAKGPKDLLGYLDIGLNPRARSGFLQDAIVAGNIYVAVGSNDEVPEGKNKTDFYLGASLTGATVTVDGRPLIRNGTLAA